VRSFPDDRLKTREQKSTLVKVMPEHGKKLTVGVFSRPAMLRPECLKLFWHEIFQRLQTVAPMKNRIATCARNLEAIVFAAYSSADE